MATSSFLTRVRLLHSTRTIMAVTTFIASRFATTAVATSQRQQQKKATTTVRSSTQKSSSVALSSSTFHNHQSKHIITQKKRTQTIIARADVDKGGNASIPTPSTATPKTKVPESYIKLLSCLSYRGATGRKLTLWGSLFYSSGTETRFARLNRDHRQKARIPRGLRKLD